MKVDAVTARLTDTKGYTGTHKERFDTTGKGKGIAGRKDMVDQAGYVTGYKHQGTYDQDGASPAGASGSQSWAQKISRVEKRKNYWWRVKGLQPQVGVK